jgi:hypothetical protein
MRRRLHLISGELASPDEYPQAHPREGESTSVSSLDSDAGKTPDETDEETGHDPE